LKHIILATTLGLAPVILAAQSQEETDKGYLTSLIEGSLSGASRDVSILGFEGALKRIEGDFALTADDAGQIISLDINGDVTPLFDPAYQDFFGDDVALIVPIGRQSCRWPGLTALAYLCVISRWTAAVS